MKNTQKGFMGIIIIIIVALGLGIGGTYYTMNNKTSTTNNIAQTATGYDLQKEELNQKANVVSVNSTNNNSQKTFSTKVDTVSATPNLTATPKSAESTAVGTCGLVITSPSLGSKVTWPIVIKGKVLQSETTSGCAWQTSEGVSGSAQFYFNENNRGWKLAGSPVIFGPNISTTFNYTEIGLPMNTPIKVVFTEENAATIRPALSFELPLVLK